MHHKNISQQIFNLSVFKTKQSLLFTFTWNKNKRPCATLLTLMVVSAPLHCFVPNFIEIGLLILEKNF